MGEGGVDSNVLSLSASALYSTRVKSGVHAPPSPASGANVMHWSQCNRRVRKSGGPPWATSNSLSISISVIFYTTAKSVEASPLGPPLSTALQRLVSSNKTLKTCNLEIHQL